MTRSELASAYSNAVSVAAFESRFGLFVTMGLLRSYAEKPHQQRYMINPVSVTALLVYGRLEESNGRSCFSSTVRSATLMLAR
jgi:hypothetical protein